MISHLIQYTLWGAIRDRMLLSMFVLLVVGASLALFLGSSAIIEKDEFVLVFASGGLRIASILGIILFVVFFIRKSFETKDVEFLLSRPVSRVQLVLSYAFAFSLIAIILAITVGLVIVALAPHLFSNGHALWILSICIENIIMANLALFFAMVISSSASAAIASIGFYILARMMGQILGIISAPGLAGDTKSSEIMNYIMETISIFMPRLDLMGQTSWLVYGADASVTANFLLLQGTVFTALLIIACLFDLTRREF